MLIGTRANLRIDSERAVERQRRDDRVDAAAVGETRVDHRRRFVDAPADRRDDLLDDPQQVLLVLEPHGARLEHSEAFDEDAVVAVDQDIGDRWILEQRLERTKAEEFVEDVADELLALGLVERLVLLCELLGDDVADFGLDLLARHLFERLQVDERRSAAGASSTLSSVCLSRLANAPASPTVTSRCSSIARCRASSRSASSGRGLRICHMFTAPAAAPPRSLHQEGRGPCRRRVLRLISSIETPRSIAARISAKSFATV